MKHLIFAVMIAVASANAMALDSRTVDSAGFDKLSEAQKATIIKTVADQAATAVSTTSTVDTIDKYVQVGANLGKGLAATAKELGVAVNEFAATPIGQIATFLIVWHIMGGAIVHILGGVAIWIIGFSTLRYINNRAYPLKVTYDPEKRDIFGRAVKLTATRDEFSSEVYASTIVGSIIIVGAGLVAIFTF